MYKVILSADSFRQIISSALEAYAVQNGRKKDTSKHKPLETYGSLWGYKTEKHGETYYHVVAGDTDTSAHQTPDYVLAKAGANIIKTGFYQAYNPELSYLGDFHSHPYSYEHDDVYTAHNVEQQRLYQFTDGDFDSVKSVQDEGLDYRVGLVATVYKMKHRVKNTLHAFLDSKSALRFTHNGPNIDGIQKSFRCWIKVYVFADGDNSQTPDKHVQLQCSALGLMP